MTDKQKTTGSTIGIIDGNEKIINLKKKYRGNPLFKDKSISWTLLLSAKIEIIRRIKSAELINNCFTIYFSINFIDIIELKKYN